MGYDLDMDLPVAPPLAPMLAKLERALPSGPGYLFEPKWDGFRCLAFRSRDEIDLRSRHQRPLARYFPEIVEALRRLRPDRFIVDGELIVVVPEGFDFGALLARLHPAASRVERLRRETPALFVAFDLVALGDRDLRRRPFAERRAALEQLLDGAETPIVLTPMTDDGALAAEWLNRFHGGGVDGVVAKHRDLPYQPNRRAMLKIKRDRTADCVVGGVRLLVDHVPLVGSLLLGLYDDAGDLRHVGVAASFTDVRRAELAAELERYVAPLEGHPWALGFGLGRSPIGRLAGAAGRWTPELEQDWVPLRPDLVCEVAYDQWDGDRFRHPARFRRWRPDREPRSCGFDQLDVDVPDIHELMQLPR